MARAAGVREVTVALGVDELESGAEPLGRARRLGGGRNWAAGLDPGPDPDLVVIGAGVYRAGTALLEAIQASVGR